MQGSCSLAPYHLCVMQLRERVPDTFPGARAWATTFLPLVLEEARAQVQQALQQLRAKACIPVSIERVKEARAQRAAVRDPGGAAAGSTVGADVSVWFSLSAPAWPAAGSAGQPLLKPTDIILLTNCQVRRQNSCALCSRWHCRRVGR